MTNDTAPAWPDPARPGVPLNPERDAYHWIIRKGAAWAEAWRWDPDADECGTEYSGAWAESDGDGQPDQMARWYAYLGPCLTPSEVAAHTAAAWLAAREACTEMLNGFQREIIENIEDDGDLHREDGKAIKPLPHALRWLMHATAAIRALTPPADAMAALEEMLAKARREGIEEAAMIAAERDDGLLVWPDGEDIAAAIRARAGETKA